MAKTASTTVATPKPVSADAAPDTARARKPPSPKRKAPGKSAGALARGKRVRANADSSLTRLLELLDLFTSSAPYWSADELVRHTGASRSTIYRHVRALHEAGFLRPVANGNYIIGPRVIELDRQLRHTDPLYIAGDGVLELLVATTGHSALLCALFSDSVMCIREELAADSPVNLFSRGQHRPLFTGAASKIILPYLPPHQLRILYTRHRKSIANAGLGSDWTSFRSALTRIRRTGYLTTTGEFNAGVQGLSAPVFNRTGHVLGSVGIAGLESLFRDADIDELAAIVVAAAEKLSSRLNAMDSILDFPPRAIG